MNTRRLLSPKLLFLLFPLAVIIFALLAIFTSSSSSSPVLLSTTPAADSTEASVFEPIRLIFSDPIDPLLISISSSPAETWSPTVFGKVLLLNHADYLHVNTPYSLEIFYDGSPLTTLNFTTRAEQSDPRYLQEIERQMARDYPLATSFPYETTLLRAVYSAPLTLEITLKSSALSEAEAVKQVKSWIRQNGGDSGAHHYTVLPTPLPSPALIPQSSDGPLPQDDPALYEFPDEDAED